MQAAPVISQHPNNAGELVEHVEWRADMACGPQKLNPIGTPAQCNHPYSGDPLRDLSRCCRTDKCQLDIDCSCPLCTEFVSIDDDHERIKMVNQHSVHVGIVSFWPLFYGLVDNASVLDNLFGILEDEERMLSQHGVRSLSARDQFYKLDSDTYRGNLFVHFHYLLLRGLQKYYCPGSVSMTDKPELAERAEALHSTIKERIKRTVYD